MSWSQCGPVNQQAECANGPAIVHNGPTVLRILTRMTAKKLPTAPLLLWRGSGTVTNQTFINSGTTMAVTGADTEKQMLGRSEEHTSELQSRPHLVCRLLLE